jgi:hypothetical protein
MQTRSLMNPDQITWTEKKVLGVIRECRAAGQKAAKEKLADLQKAGPAFAVCTETAPFSDEIDQVVGTMLDVCGGAYLKIKARGKFYALAKKLSENDSYRFGCYRGYYGGGRLSIFDMSGRQEMSVNIAACHAAGDVLDKYGIENTTDSYID